MKMPYLSLLICIDFKSVIAARTASATYETICKGAPQRKNCTAGVFWSKVGISFFSIIIIVIEEEEQQGHYLDRGGRPSTIHLRSMTRRGNNFSAGYVLNVCSMNHKVATHQQETVHSFVLHLWYFSISGWLWKMPLLGHTETQWLGSSHWF